MAKITINDLLEAGCHFGHQTKRWNPKMKPYVYGAKNGISIIDLTKTMRQLVDACNFLQTVVAKGGEVLFVGTKRQARDIIKGQAERTGMYYVSERWLGGTLTNNVTIRKSIAKMRESDKILTSDVANGMKKKELALLSRNNVKLHRDLDGIAEMKKLPSALVLVDVCNELNAVREANKLNIPIVAIVDTNGDPTMIEYPVAANDDAVKSIEIITNVFADSIAVATEIYRKRVAEERDAKEAAAKKADDDKEESAEDKPARKAPRRAPAKKADKGDDDKKEAVKELEDEVQEDVAEKKAAVKKPAAKKPAKKSDAKADNGDAKAE
ncbi:MAG: 30S ribosomal protein S2 [Victivallaceae bacterium]|nr:30S ribosomal protein S2 [Victivallaceae bacterium]